MNPDIFEELFHQYFAKICRYCFYYVRNQQDAEELGLEAFVKAYCSFDPAQQVKFPAFIFKIAHNLCLDFFKSRRYHQHQRTFALEDDDSWIDPSPDADGELSQKELLAVLYRCLDNLTAESHLLNLYYLEGFTYREIAAILNKSINTAKSRIETGIKHLKACLQKNGILDNF